MLKINQLLTTRGFKNTDPDYGFGKPYGTWKKGDVTVEKIAGTHVPGTFLIIIKQPNLEDVWFDSGNTEKFKSYIKNL